MGGIVRGAVISAGFSMLGSAARSSEAVVASGPAAGYQVVPAAERLTLFRVLANATPTVQLVMVLLIAATLVAVVIWAASLPKVGQGDAKGLAGALGRLRIVRSSGALLGLLAASITLLSGFIGMANVRPTPSLAVLAPGWAEAALAVMLGLLASAVAVICERHLEGRIRRAAA